MNRTPREILFERHRAAEVRLDAIRERFLVHELIATGGATANSGRDVVQLRVRLSVRIWGELFWSCRQIWAGLAAAWLVVIVVNFKSFDEPASTQVGNGGASQAFWTFVLEQKRLLAELGDDTPASPQKATPVAPRPRSDRREINRARC